MRHRIGRGLIAFLPALTLTVCIAPFQQPTTYTAYGLTCCTHSDIYSLWRPGTTVELHLIPTTSSVTMLNPTHKVRLTATLSGPYADATALKHGGAVATSIGGTPITFDDREPQGAGKVVVFVLPADTRPGLYNLGLTWDLGGAGSADAGSVVRVGS